MTRTKGAVEFSKLCGKIASAAAKLSVSQPTISLWRSGKRVPHERHQLEIEEKFGIPRALWTELPDEPDRGPVAEEPATIADARALARDDLAMAQRLTRQALRDAENEPDLQRQAAIITKLTSSLQAQQRMAGTSRELDPKQILASPAWDEVENAMVAALRPWPDAMVAVKAALDDLSGTLRAVTLSE